MCDKMHDVNQNMLYLDECKILLSAKQLISYIDRTYDPSAKQSNVFE